MKRLKSVRLILAILIINFSFSQTPLFAQDAAVVSAPGLKPMPQAALPKGLDKTSGLDQKDQGLQDHKASVFDFKGDVKILKQDSEDWKPVEKNMVIDEGDQILTGSESTLDVAYDNFFLNIARIEEKTRAEFRSIEPTDLYLENGTIFSALDGLNGNKYQISTRTAVAGVRGTHLDVGAFHGDFTHVAVLFDEKPYESHVDVVLNGENFDVKEGQQMNMGDMGKPEIQDNIDGNIVQRTGNFVSDVKENFAGIQEEAKQELSAFSAPKEDKVDAQDQKASEEPAPALKDDDSNKPKAPNDGGGGNGPNGPMDQPGGPAGPGGGDLLANKVDSEVDALVDNLIPTEEPAVPASNEAVNTDQKTDSKKDKEEKTNKGEDRPVTKTSGNPTPLNKESLKSGPATNANLPATAAGPSATANSGAERKVDYGKAMEFLSIGGMGTTAAPAASGPQNNPTNIQQMTSAIMTNIGMDRRSAQMFGQFVQKYSDIGGEFQHFMTGGDAYAATPVTTNAPMMSGPIGVGTTAFQPIMDPSKMDGAMVTNPDGTTAYMPSPYMDPTYATITNTTYDTTTDLAKIVNETTYNGSYVPPPTQPNYFDIGLQLAANNPFYYRVLEALSKDLTATEKAALLAQPIGSELVRSSPVLAPNIDQDANPERIFGVKYINGGTVVNADYEKIMDDVTNGSTVTLQPDDSVNSYHVVVVQACNSSDPESGCA